MTAIVDKQPKTVGEITAVHLCYTLQDVLGEVRRRLDRGHTYEGWAEEASGIVEMIDTVKRDTEAAMDTVGARKSWRAEK